jgi:capsular exopolysaccharide synthesis family protein
MTSSGQTTFGDYLRVLRRSRWLIAAVTVLCAGVALAYSVLATPTYESSAQLTVRDPAQDLNQIGTQSGTATLPLQLASTHAPDVTRPAVVRKVKKDLGLSESVDAVRSLVTVEVDSNAYTDVITAESSDANEAAHIADAFANADVRLTTKQARKQYAEQAERLAARLDDLPKGEDPTGGTLTLSRVQTLEGLAATAEPVVVSAAAQVPSSPVSPQPIRDVAAATLIGLLLGIGIAYGRSMFDRRLRDPDAVEEVLGQPVLARLRGTIFGHTGSVKDAERAGLGPLDPIDGEAFRMLRENLRYLSVDRELKTTLVTSAIPEEGKSTVAACLAMANAGSGKRTLLVECDLRRRVLAGRFGLAEAPGLSDYLAGNATPSNVLQLVPIPGVETANGGMAPSLVCITAGSAPPRPADILSSERFADFIDKVSRAYDRVIIDCPPLLPVADTLEIAPHCDCVLLCVRLNQTTSDQLEAARDALSRLPSRPMGLVVTDFAEHRGYYGDYYKYYSEDPAATGSGAQATAPASSVAPT